MPEPALTFIGAGQMGMPMVRRLVAAGRPTTVYARRPDVRDDCEAIGATAVADVHEAVADADFVMVCLYSDAQLVELTIGPDGFLDSTRPGATLVIHTTGSPVTSNRLSEHGARRGVHVVEAPVSGSAEDIDEGHITVLLGGEVDDVERVREVVAAYGDPVLHVGPLGAAQAVKLLNNALMSAHLQLLADVERVALELHVDWPQAIAAIQQSSGTSLALDVVGRMGSVHTVMEAAGRFLRKDVAAVNQVAAEMGIDLGELGRVNRLGSLALGEPPRSDSSPADDSPADSSPADDSPAGADNQVLVDIEQIKQLKARYFRLLDTKDWDGFAELFTDDCEHLLPTEDPRAPVPNAAYLADIRLTLAGAVTVHHGVCPEITILGPRDAEGVWAMFDDVELTQPPHGPARLQGYGHYRETYRKGDDGRWRISSKQNVRLRVDTLPSTGSDA